MRIKNVIYVAFLMLPCYNYDVCVNENAVYAKTNKKVYEYYDKN